jgi:hypothetical protein
MNRTKQWFKRKTKQAINSKTFLFLIGILIGGTMVFNYLEGKELYQEIFAIKTVYIAQASGEGVQVNSHQAVKQAEVITTHSEGEAETNPSQLAIKRIAEKYDIDWKLVYAVCKVESNCNSDRIGDNGGSYGYYQISLPHHPDITKEQARDINFSTEWTIKHCEKYKNDIRMFAKCHNGLNKTTNGWYMDRVENMYNSI